MYLKFYGLTEKPFSQTPDPKFLYWNDAYREALANLRYGIQERKGFLTMIGEAGTGKTTLLRKLLDDLGSDVLSVFLFNPNATFEEILEYTLGELGITAPSGRKLAMLQRLNEFLLAAFAEGRNTILLIDEAQDLETDVLESLRLLSNLETSKEKILQIVLSGQPELGARLAQENLRQLKQRIAVRCRLEPLQRSELGAYIKARLSIAGCEESLFAEETLDPIWAFARGIPRLVNTICDNALLVGYALGKRPIDRQVIAEVSADLSKLDVDGVAPVSPLQSTAERSAAQATAPPFAVAAAPAIAPAAPAQASPAVAEVRAAAESPPRRSAAPETRPEPTTDELRRTISASAPAQGRSGFSLAALLMVALASGAAAFWASRNLTAERPAMAPAAERTGTLALAPVPPAMPVRPAPAPVAGPSSAAEVVAAARSADPANDNPEAAPPHESGSAERDGTLPAHPAPEEKHVASSGAGVNAGPAEVHPASPPSAAAGEESPTARLERTPAEPGERAAALAEQATGAEKHATSAQLFQLQATSAAGPGRRILIRRGDTLFNLASRAYGSANFTTIDILRAANPGIDDVNVILAGNTLLFPDPGPTARVVGGGHDLAVLAMTTPALVQAQSVQRKLQDQYQQRVDIESTGAGEGRKLYRVFLRDFAGEAQAKDAAESLGPILRDPES